MPFILSINFTYVIYTNQLFTQLANKYNFKNKMSLSTLSGLVDLEISGVNIPAKPGLKAEPAY